MLNILIFNSLNISLKFFFIEYVVSYKTYYLRFLNSASKIFVSLSLYEQKILPIKFLLDTTLNNTYWIFFNFTSVLD